MRASRDDSSHRSPKSTCSERLINERDYAKWISISKSLDQAYLVDGDAVLSSDANPAALLIIKDVDLQIFLWVKVTQLPINFLSEFMFCFKGCWFKKKKIQYLKVSKLNIKSL